MLSELIINNIPTAYHFDAGVIAGSLMTIAIAMLVTLFNKYIHIGG